MKSQRGAMNCEYAGELAQFVERTNCMKGCVHAKVEDGPGPYQWVNCALGLLTALFVEGTEVPELEAHGNRYVVCTAREKPETSRSWPQAGPDLFGGAS